VSYRLTRTATAQVDDILVRSAAAERYALLLQFTFEAVGRDPTTPGGRPVPRLSGVFFFPTRLVGPRIPPRMKVGAPRHLIIYRIANDGMVEILGLAHDRMVLSRAAHRAMHGADGDTD